MKVWIVIAIVNVMMMRKVKKVVLLEVNLEVHQEAHQEVLDFHQALEVDQNRQ